MIPYLTLVVVVFLLSVFSIQPTNKDKILRVVLICLAFFSGFRFKVGTDFENYENIYNGVMYYEVKEKGFQYFIALLNSFGGTSQLMFLILALFTMFLMYKIITYYSENYTISVLIFLLIPTFFLETFNGMRQVIAILLFIYSIKFVVDKKYFKYIFIIAFGAFFFHESIIIVGLLFPLINKRLSKKKKLIIFILTLILSIYIERIISITPYLNYLEVEKNINVSIFTYTLFVIIVLMTIFEDKIGEFKNRDVLLNLNFFSLLTLLMVLLQTKDILIMLFMRFNNYFFYGFIVLIPNILSTIKDRATRFVISLFIVMFSLYYFYITITITGQRYLLVPFNFNFDLF